MWLLCTLKMVVIKPRNCPQQTHSNVDRKESRLKDKLEQMKKDLPTACLAPSFATVVMDKQIIGCDEVGAASVAQVSKSTQREGVSYFVQSQPAASSREEPPRQQPTSSVKPHCAHVVLGVSAHWAFVLTCC